MVYTLRHKLNLRVYGECQRQNDEFHYGFKKLKTLGGHSQYIWSKIVQRPEFQTFPHLLHYFSITGTSSHQQPNQETKVCPGPPNIQVCLSGTPHPEHLSRLLTPSICHTEWDAAHILHVGVKVGVTVWVTSLWQHLAEYDTALGKSSRLCL